MDMSAPSRVSSLVHIRRRMRAIFQCMQTSKLELTELQAVPLVHVESLRVTGTGYCTILDVSYAESARDEQEKVS